MAQEKENEKKDVKVQDLAPKKDAKGGAARSADGSQSADGRKNLDGGGRGLDGGGRSLDGGSRGAN